MLARHTLALREDRRRRSRDVLAGSKACDVRADDRDRERRVVDPGAVMVVEDTRTAREVEPRILRRPRSRRAICGPRGFRPVEPPARPRCLPFPLRRRRRARPRAQRGAGALRRVGARARRPRRPSSRSSGRRCPGMQPGSTRRREVCGVAEIEELEVVLEDAIDALEQSVEREEQLVRRAQPPPFRDDGLVFELTRAPARSAREARPSLSRPSRASGRTARPSGRSSSRRDARTALPVA